MEPVKGSREISLKNAALRQSRPHRVSFLSSASYTPTSLDGVSLDSRVASLPYESSSLAHPAPLRGPLPLKGTQDVTGLPSCCINRTVLSAELATSGGFSPFGALRHHLSPRESVSLGSQVAITPLRTKFACRPAVRGHNKAPAFRHAAFETQKPIP